MTAPPPPRIVTSVLIYVETPFRFHAVYRIYYWAHYIQFGWFILKIALKYPTIENVSIRYYWNKYAFCRVHVPDE